MQSTQAKKKDWLWAFLNTHNLLLHSRDIDGREIAVRGFLNILDDQLSELKVNENSAQAEGIVFEILGNS